MRKKKEVPCHNVSESEMIASMASHPYEWARVKSGSSLYVLSKDDPGSCFPYYFTRRKLREVFPIAAICLDKLRELYGSYRPLTTVRAEDSWCSFLDERPEIANTMWTKDSWKEFISADIFQDLLHEHVIVRHNKGLSDCLSIIARKGGEYNDIDEIKAALLAQFLVRFAMTATCEDSGVQSPVLGHSKEIIQ